MRIPDLRAQISLDRPAVAGGSVSCGSALTCGTRAKLRLKRTKAFNGHTTVRS
jgi:hypothetical protein